MPFRPLAYNTQLSSMNKDQRQQYAKELYMRNVIQKEIAERVGVSLRTVQNWIPKFGWAEQRAAMSISTATLVPKALAKINELLDQEEFDSKMADQLAKTIKALEQLNKGVSVIDEIDVFMRFDSWLQKREVIDSSLTTELIQQINHFQNQYITERVAANGK